MTVPLTPDLMDLFPDSVGGARLLTSRPVVRPGRLASQWSPGTWAATQALEVPDTFGYGDIATAWAPLPQNGTLEYLTLGFLTPVYADGVLVRETYGNGFVYQIDLIDVGDAFPTIWNGVDPSLAGTPVDFANRRRSGFGYFVGNRLEARPCHAPVDPWG